MPNEHSSAARLRAVSGGTPRPAAPALRPPRRRRYRYFRRHTPHYFIVLTAVTAAIFVLMINSAAYKSGSLGMARAGLIATGIATLIICSAFFWGFSMVMGGNIPVHRLKYLVPHAAVGLLSPLFWAFNFTLALDNLGQRTSLELVIISGVCLVLLAVQFSMGKAVVHREPLHLVSSERARRMP